MTEKTDKTQTLSPNFQGEAFSVSSIPKFCSNIQLAVMNTGNIIVSLGFTDPQGSATPIETVLIDIEHAKNFHKVLGEIIAQVEVRTSASNAESIKR